jgi:hypothetical protein
MLDCAVEEECSQARVGMLGGEEQGCDRQQQQQHRRQAMPAEQKQWVRLVEVAEEAFLL